MVALAVVAACGDEVVAVDERMLVTSPEEADEDAVACERAELAMRICVDTPEMTVATREDAEDIVALTFEDAAETREVA